MLESWGCGVRTQEQIQSYIDELKGRLQRLSKHSLAISICDLADVEEATCQLGELEGKYRAISAWINALEWSLEDAESFDDDIPF